MNSKEKRKENSKRIRNIFILLFILGILLGVSTYAWFIGMKTVNLSNFDVKIATTEGLYISLDAKSWVYNLDVTTAEQYPNNTNVMENVKLIPVSTVGDVDTNSSTMKLFSKSSLTAYPATHDEATGKDKSSYRLLAKRMDNYNTLGGVANTGIEHINASTKGYFAFDLFFKNVSGEAYYVENNVNNEEAIYLTTNSKVGVGTVSGVDGTGIENSVRVAFAQIGRVEDTTANEGANAYMATCKTEGLVTGICRPAQIWEPNEKKHVVGALNFYNSVVGGTFGLNDYVNTYAVYEEIDAPGVDMYNPSANGTRVVDYFTDEEKMLEGADRPQFMSLAPNSITKVRVYIYIEGQDIDNYDFAALGKQISVNFGFTKERFQESDIGYTGPNTYITPTDSTIVETNGSEIESGYENDYPMTGAVISSDSVARR